MKRLRMVAAALVIGAVAFFAPTVKANDLCNECAPVYWEVKWLEYEIEWMDYIIGKYPVLIAYQESLGDNPALVEKMTQDMEDDKLYRTELSLEMLQKDLWLGQCTICN